TTETPYVTALFCSAGNIALPIFYREGAMKRILTATAIAAALAAPNAQAGSTSGTFNVNVTLTSACTLSAVTNLAFAYTSLQAAVANATGGGFSVSCTNSLPYTFGLQSGNGAATPPGASTLPDCRPNVF